MDYCKIMFRLILHILYTENKNFKSCMCLTSILKDNSSGKDGPKPYNE